MQRIARITNRKQAFGDVVERAPRGLEAFSEGVEDFVEMIPTGQLMLSRHAVMRPAEFLVVTQVGETAGLGAMKDALRKNARDEKGVVADVSPKHETGAFIGGLQRGEHLEKVVERIGLAGKNAFRAACFGKSREDFGDVIGYGAILQVGALKNVADEDVEIKAGGNSKAAAIFQQRMEERGVVEDEVARFLVGEQLDKTIGRSDATAKHIQDEVHIRRRKLNPAVRLDHFHRHSTLLTFDDSPARFGSQSGSAKPINSIISSKKGSA